MFIALSSLERHWLAVTFAEAGEFESAVTLLDSGTPVGSEGAPRARPELRLEAGNRPGMIPVP
ncbi:MAG: hypothetical protein HQM00_05085 [Magnetococcales bacterium]|nr:hypothetical protein [Magnetococcales bacterium]